MRLDETARFGGPTKVSWRPLAASWSRQCAKSLNLAFVWGDWARRTPNIVPF
jgi:hypothetical protein